MPMTRLFLTVFALIGTVILLWDVSMSIASLQWGFDYTQAAIGSFFIHACAGFFICRFGNLAMSLAIGAALGLLDSTVGWYLSWIIGPGRVEGLDTFTALTIIATVTCTGAIESLLGGLFGLINRPARD